jgi:quercetin dioxygenase-like cupin family protein
MEKQSLASMKSFSADGFVLTRVWQTDKLLCNISCFVPAQLNSLHRHPVSDEVAICLEGVGIVVAGDGQ